MGERKNGAGPTWFWEVCSVYPGEKSTVSMWPRVDYMWALSTKATEETVSIASWEG